MLLLPFLFERFSIGLPDIEKQIKRKRAGNAISCGPTCNDPAIIVNYLQHLTEYISISYHP